MREADIRPKDIHDRYLNLSAHDAATYFGDPTRRTNRACPGCGEREAEHKFTKNSFRIEGCQKCGSLFANPAPLETDLDRFYRDSPSSRFWATDFFPAVAEARRPKIFAPRAARVADLAVQFGATQNNLIDVGAGAGIFLEEYLKLVPNALLRAVEPGGELSDQLENKGIEVFRGFAKTAAQGWSGSASLVTCFEVIEHVVDVADLFTDLATLAEPNGLIVVSGLTSDGFDIQALGSESKAIAPPHHLTFLSKQGISTLAAKLGLELLDLFTPGLLDVDIVRNATIENAELELEPETMEMINSNQADRDKFQQRLVSENRSSHMWVVLRRPANWG